MVAKPYPEFSILMANYNNGKYIAEAIQSVIDQTHSKWELIIMDDCSTDNSIHVIDKFLYDSRIRLIMNSSNIGYTNTLLELLSEIKSPLFGILDSDDVLTFDAVKLMCDAHKSNPNCGFIYSQFMFCDEDLNPIRKGYCREIPVGCTNLRDNYSSAFRTIKKVAYLKTAGFNSEFTYGQDRDIIFKMEEITQLLFVEKILYKHRILPWSQSNDPIKKRIGRCFAIMGKYDAYLRRKNTNIPSLTKREMSIELFIGMLLSLRLMNFIQVKFFMSKVLILNPFIIFSFLLYSIDKIFKKLHLIINPQFRKSQILFDSTEK